MKISFGNATFVVDITDDYDDSDGVGFGHFEVNRKQYAELYEARPFGVYDTEVPDWDEDEHDEDESVLVSNGDDFITFAYTASIEGGRFDITYGGAPYWLFHDLSHATYDCSGIGVEIDRYGVDENRALWDGAQRAFEHGVNLADILREMAKAEVLFSDRFPGAVPEGIEHFAKFLQDRLTKGPA